MTRRKLTYDDAINAVYGGCILGGGGGGLLREGLERAAVVFPSLSPVLATIDEFDADALAPCVALVGAPSSREMFLSPDQIVETVERIRAEVPIVAIMTNENGAATTTNGWLQAASIGVPVLDSPANGRAHPTGLMGALNLSEEADYLSIQAFAGGAGERRVSGVISGALGVVSHAVRSMSVEAGGMVAVCRNPVTIEYLSQNAALGGISQAIELGALYRSQPEGVVRIAAVTDRLGGRILSRGTVSSYRLEQSGGFDVGVLLIGDLELTVWNEYMTAEISGERVGTFPDLIMTFDSRTGDPVVSAEISVARDITTLLVPRSRLLLGTTMHNPRLLKSIEAIVEKPIISYIVSA